MNLRKANTVARPVDVEVKRDDKPKDYGKARACVVCGAYLSRYNGDTRCYAHR